MFVTEVSDVSSHRVIHIYFITFRVCCQFKNAEASQHKLWIVGQSVHIFRTSSNTHTHTHTHTHTLIYKAPGPPVDSVDAIS